jgi:hypothetical protein
MLTRHRRKRRELERWLLCGVLLVTGCTHWHTERMAPAALLTSKTPSRIRVTRTDRSRVVVHHPRLVGDTIVDGRPKRSSGTRVPLSDVSAVAVRKVEPFRTTGLVLGTLVVASFAALAAVWQYPD